VRDYKKFKLKIWGKAQRESAQRLMSDRGKIKGMRIVDLGKVNMSAYNFARNGPKFTIFFVQRRKDRFR